MDIFQNETVVEALFGILIVVIGWGIKHLADIVKNQKLLGALTILATTIENTVKSLNQTVVEDLKKANADGILTDDEKKQIKEDAINIVKSQLTDGVKQILEYAYTNLDDVLDKWIEAAVFSNKPVDIAKSIIKYQ
jgi:hemoglobin-like flavoprotein